MSYILDLHDPYLAVLSSSVPCSSFKVEIESKVCADSEQIVMAATPPGGDVHFSW